MLHIEDGRHCRGESRLDKLDEAPEPERRQPYEKPSIAWEETLEIRKTLAVACAKVAGRSAICNQFPTS